MNKALLTWGLAASLMLGCTMPASWAVTHKSVAPAKADTAKSYPANDPSYKEVSPLDLLHDSDKLIGEKVRFKGTFVSFSPYALDYKGAMRSSKDYIAFLIKRPDVAHHTIPLSELKLIYPRKKADKVVELENGDTVSVQGKVFSAALGDPWVDVDSVTLLQKSPENIAKNAKKKKKHELD